MIGISLPKNKEMSLKKMEDYLNPDKVYFSYTKEDTLVVKEGDMVEEGDLLIRRKKFASIVPTSISGIVSFEKINNLDYVVIQNNGKEKKYEAREANYTYTKTEVLDILSESGIIGMGGAGFPTHVKYDTKEKIKTLIVNAVECEPYITADYALALQHPKEIVKGIHYLMQALHIKEAYIAIKAQNPLLKEKLLTVSDKYKKIKIVEVPNLYPMGWEKSLVRYIKHTDYKNLPIEKGIVVNNISTIYAIYEALRLKHKMTSRLVTFTGEGMKNPCNIKIKIGTPLKSVLEAIGGIKEDSILILGGPMMGTVTDLENVFLTPNINCVLALTKKEYQTITCLRCGKCTENCPSKISPILIAENKKDVDTLKYLHPEKCIECGICSYICPSKIDVREQVVFAKNKVKKGVKK